MFLLAPRFSVGKAELFGFESRRDDAPRLGYIHP